MKRKKRWMLPGVITATAVLFVTFVDVRSNSFKWADWTGFGEDIEITQIDEVDSNCTANNSNCAVIKRTLSRKYQAGKTFWDWLGLAGAIAIPLLLVYLANKFQAVQQKQAEESAKEEVLQAYFDRLSDLLIEKNVIALAIKNREAAKEEDAITAEQRTMLSAAKDVIRARTLSVLRRFGEDGERKGDVIRFLSDTDIASTLQPLDLNGAPLSGAKLFNVKLPMTLLFDADLSNANLVRANLRDTSLSRANLSDSDLSHSILQRATLTDADIHGAILRNANLSQADFSEVKNWTEEQLSQAKLCQTRLPATGTDLNPNRDCEELGMPKY